jgi:hypothetical protein
MLFDLRSRGRRRTVQAVYIGLVLLFLMGFLGFGVGGGFGGGGIFENVFGNKEGKAVGFADKVAAAEKLVRKKPAEAAAWAALAEAQLHQSGEGEFYNEATEKFTSAGKALLVKVAHSWERYLALNPSKPDPSLAQRMLSTVYSEAGLNQPAAEVGLLQQVLIPSQPTSAKWYGFLAQYAYRAKNPHVGDLASKKALDLTPSGQRSQVKQQLERVKANPSGNPENEKYTGTVGGKKYNFKPTKSGKSFTGTPAPATAPTKK